MRHMTITEPLAREIIDVLGKLTASDAKTERLRVDIIYLLDTWVKDDDFPDHHDAQEN